MNAAETIRAAAAVPVGTRVVYAGGLYTVAAVNGDLLTLDGVAVVVSERGIGVDGVDLLTNRRYGRCRPRVTVLAGDVTRVGEEA